MKYTYVTIISLDIPYQRGMKKKIESIYDPYAQKNLKFIRPNKVQTEAYIPNQVEYIVSLINRKLKGN